MKNFGRQLPGNFYGGAGGFDVFRSERWFSDNFGAFTFDMAEEVFDRVFREMDERRYLFENEV